MGFSVQLRYGELAATMSTDEDYSPLLADDLAGICRRELVAAEAELLSLHAVAEAINTEAEASRSNLTHAEAMRRDYLLDDDD